MPMFVPGQDSKDLDGRSGAVHGLGETVGRRRTSG